MAIKRSGNCVFLIEAINGGGANCDAPTIVIGKVVPTNTGGREATQDPMTHFDCDDTPLGKGHIVALFLGGPDIPENYRRSTSSGSSAGPGSGPSRPSWARPRPWPPTRASTCSSS